jgi:hypothetical protein
MPCVQYQKRVHGLAINIDSQLHCANRTRPVHSGSQRDAALLPIPNAALVSTRTLPWPSRDHVSSHGDQFHKSSIRSRLCLTGHPGIRSMV